MRQLPLVRALLVLVVMSPSAIVAQSAQSVSAAAVPRLISLSGVFRPADGQPAGAVETVTLSIYADQEGGAPLWQETQTIPLDGQGRYSLLLGASQADGIPAAVFASGEAQWWGLVFERAGEVEGPRVRITSVPYALRAAEADTLGGRPASDYLLAAAPGDSGSAAAASGDAPPGVSADLVLPGTDNFLAKYVNGGADVDDSAVFEHAGRVGIGTAAPLDSLHINFTNTDGAVTGLAVRNLGNTATSYSGMLFYDQNGLLGQFQGFNNGTHEYRINNIARVSPAGAFNGSINFMIGGFSKFYVSPISVGIGTIFPSPSSNLDVSNAISGSGTTNVNITTFSANAFGPNLIGRKARGTEALPTSILNNDALLNLNAHGYGAAGFVNSAGISMRASENWTAAAQGSIINFDTTANGTTGALTRMTIGPSGRIGIGVFGAQANLEVSNQNGASGAGMIYTTTFTNAGASLFVGRRARGTGIAPSAVLSGDNLVGYEGAGYGTTGFGFTRGGMLVTAAENWTDTAQGARLHFTTTATGTTTGGTRMTIDPVGNVGIGTTVPQVPLEVSRTGTHAAVLATAYANGTDAGSFLVAQTARGTAAAPLAVQAGDPLGVFGTVGYGATGFGSLVTVVAGVAAENFTAAARGSALGLGTTPLGATNPVLVMGLLPSGNVGIGTPADGNGLPTATDRLQVFGDARVGNAGTNGCLKNFAGTGIAGTCASDRRFKKDITPFGPVLDQLTALQPVHYSWRAGDFPEQHFGDGRAYGLIAQEVEQTLPELVVTSDDGFKAVDYSKLPLLTIQAVKELKAENDAWKQRVAELDPLKQRVAEIDPLKQRLAELERLVNELLAAASGR